jgi:hypothetical protein
VESHPKPPAAIGGNGSIEEFWPSYARDPSGKLGKLLSPLIILLPWRLGTSPGRPCSYLRWLGFIRILLCYYYRWWATQIPIWGPTRRPTPRNIHRAVRVLFWCSPGPRSSIFSGLKIG